MLLQSDCLFWHVATTVKTSCYSLNDLGVTFTVHVAKELLSVDDMDNLLQATGCSAELQRPSCDSDCLSDRYRSSTGECNNQSVLMQTDSNRCRLSFLYFLMLCLMSCLDSIPDGALQTSRTPAGCLRSMRTPGGHPGVGTQSALTITPLFLR